MKRVIYVIAGFLLPMGLDDEDDEDLEILWREYGLYSCTGTFWLVQLIGIIA